MDYHKWLQIQTSKCTGSKIKRVLRILRPYNNDMAFLIILSFLEQCNFLGYKTKKKEKKIMILRVHLFAQQSFDWKEKRTIFFNVVLSAQESV